MKYNLSYSQLGWLGRDAQYGQKKLYDISRNHVWYFGTLKKLHFQKTLKICLINLISKDNLS